MTNPPTHTNTSTHPQASQTGYVHGFVTAVPTANKAEYIKFCTSTGAALKRLGATEAVECWGVDVPDGKVTSFPLAVKKQADETVVFSWTRWPSQEVAEAAEAKMRAGEIPEFDFAKNQPPFDGKRLIYGGFEVVIDMGEMPDPKARCYVTGFVWACPTAIKDKYIEFNTRMGEALMRLGGLKVVECWGVEVPPGKVTSFPLAVKQKPNEAVDFSWVVWPSKAVADAAMANMRAGEGMPDFDPTAASNEGDHAFDPSRLIYGGFEMVVHQ